MQGIKREMLFTRVTVTLYVILHLYIHIHITLTTLVVICYTLYDYITQSLNILITLITFTPVMTITHYPCL